MASMDTSRAGAATSDAGESERLARALLVLAAGCAAVTALLAFVAIMLAHRSPITSDESLYLSEALNIAKGIGPRYTTHDLVQHRPFLFPALIALPMKITGGFGGIYWLNKGIVTLDAVVLGAIVLRMFGRPAGVAAFVLALSSRFLGEFGTTLYLDSTETLFLLLALLCVWEMRERRGTLLPALAGLSLALAFLTKEAALLWFPLPALFILLTEGPHTLGTHLRRVTPLYVTFAAAAGWWWVYVWHVDSRVYLWPYGPVLLAAAIVGCAGGLIVAGSAYALVRRHSPDRARLALRAGALGMTIAWIAVWTYSAERDSWPHPHDYLHTVPSYLRDIVAGNAAPWPLFAAGVIAMFVRARSDDRYRLLALAFALWIPFAMLVANLGFALRDLMPMMYIGYGVAGIAAAELLSWLQRQVDGRAAMLAAVAITVVGAGYFASQSLTLIRQHRGDPPAASADWNNALVRETAAFIEANVPEGASIMSSRRYFSQLYVLTDARYPIEQLPTVNVVPHPGDTPYLRVRSTLFRWQDNLLPAPETEQDWISVDAYAAKHYYTALSQEDLLRQIEYRKSDYLVLSGEDVAFSTTRYRDYFSAPAFKQLYHAALGDAGEIYVFQIDLSRLTSRNYRTVVPATVLNSLYAEAGGRLTASQLLDAINPAGITVSPEDGLSTDVQAALAEQ